MHTSPVEVQKALKDIDYSVKNRDLLSMLKSIKLAVR
jgi:hypothetical protein